MIQFQKNYYEFYPHFLRTITIYEQIYIPRILLIYRKSWINTIILFFTFNQNYVAQGSSLNSHASVNKLYIFFI